MLERPGHQHDAGDEHQKGDGRQDEKEEILLGHTVAWRPTRKKLPRCRPNPRAVSETDTGRPGDSVVVGIYLLVVVLAGLMGFVLGTIRPVQLEPTLFGVVALPPTPVGVAVYGVVTVGLGLGALLVLVVLVSRLFAEDGGTG